MAEINLAIIGGSGLYNMEGLVDVEEIQVNTPFGDPSNPITIGTLQGKRLAFLPRHGRGHVLSPSEVPYQANIFALKKLGVKYIISVSACGSLREDYQPGQIVVPDQLFDHTKNRAMTFFGRGLVAHIGVPHPFSPEFSRVVSRAISEVGGDVHEGGTFITIEGPRFSTKGETHVYRQWGMDIIGMTTSPEAFLALEAEISYACMAHITDYDVWHEDAEPVTAEQVFRIVHQNTSLAQRAIIHIVKTMDEWAGDFEAHHHLHNALSTDPSLVPAELKETLKPLVAKYLD